MKDKITQFRHYLDFDKEIAYINEMNKKGWKLVYIKLGCFYTFLKTEPDEYVTILHADDKENISSVAAFAAQCGYENIPHTVDGVGDIMYLTGKKSEISGEFLSDNESKLRLSKKMVKKYNLFTVLYIILLVFVALETLFCFSATFAAAYYTGDSDIWTSLSIPIGFMVLLTILVIVLLICILRSRSRILKKHRALQEELNIYE